MIKMPEETATAQFSLPDLKIQFLKTLSWMSLAIMEWTTMSSNPSEGNSSSTGSSQADSRQPSGQSLFSWAANRSSSSGPQKIRVTILCARSLVKRDLFRLPDPFVKVHVDGSGQSHVTEAGKNTLDPKWNVHYDLYVGSNDAITICYIIETTINYS